MSRPDPNTEREQQLPGGCALGCVGASMIMALTGLAATSLIALALGLGQSVQAMVGPHDSDSPAVADHGE